MDESLDFRDFERRTAGNDGLAGVVGGGFLGEGFDLGQAFDEAASSEGGNRTTEEATAGKLVLVDGFDQFFASG